MLENETGRFPNIINKKKLAPLPLLRQNLSPTKLQLDSPKISMRSPLSAHTLFLSSSSKALNNYGRMCDQPFLEFSNYHSQQLFGSGGGKKRVHLEPLKQNKLTVKKANVMKMHTIASSTGLPSPLPPSHTLKMEDTAASQRLGSEPDVHVPEPDNHAVIKKAYKIGIYEAVIKFSSLHVTATEGAEKGKELSAPIGKKDLKKIYHYSVDDIVKVVTKRLVFKHGHLRVNMKGHIDDEHTDAEEDIDYPENKTNIPVRVNDHDLMVTLEFPYLEISIDQLDYKEKVVLRPSFLANLFEAQFNNLEEYVSRFDLPARVTKTEEEVLLEQLKSLPTIIKKVVKTDDFGGVMLFKSLEIHLKNTSDIQPNFIMNNELTSPNTKNIVRNRTKDLNTVLLRMSAVDLKKILRLTTEELTSLMKSSIQVEEGKGFVIKVDEYELSQLGHRHREYVSGEALPETSGKFIVRFNKFLYEGFIKFPTLELYIPETNYKNVLQLSEEQIEALLKNSFENMLDYIPLFEKSNTKKFANDAAHLLAPEEKVESHVAASLSIPTPHQNDQSKFSVETPIKEEDEGEQVAEPKKIFTFNQQ